MNCVVHVCKGRRGEVLLKKSIKTSPHPSFIRRGLFDLPEASLSKMQTLSVIIMINFTISSYYKLQVIKIKKT